MNAFNSDLLVDAFPLVNTGSICYFNSLLQVLASCTSLHAHDIIAKFLRDHNTTYVLGYLCATLKLPITTFGTGQQCASETLIFLIDAAKLSNKFEINYESVFICRECTRETPPAIVTTVDADMFVQTTPENFIPTLLTHISESEVKCCEKKMIRRYRVKSMSEIIVCKFNTTGIKLVNYFPIQIKLPCDNGTQIYNFVGKIDHYGSSSGGHYTATCVRKNGIYLCNDSHVSPVTTIAPDSSTFLVIYHYIKLEN